MDKTYVSSWLSNKPTFHQDKQLLVAHSLPFNLDMIKLAAKSGKVSTLMRQNPHIKSSSLFQHMPSDPEIFELVAKFCHGFELKFASENVMSLICVANYLEMTDDHNKDNLLNMAVRFFEQRVLPSWNETIKALRSAGKSLQEAMRLGLFEACIESLAEKALVDPHLIENPAINSSSDEDSGDEEEEEHIRNPRRRLFTHDWNLEDLTTLPLQVYQPIIRAMVQRRVPSEYIAASLCMYTDKWVFSGRETGENSSILKRNSSRDVIEAVESLLPNEKGLIPCALLIKILKSAISFETSYECRNSLEIRIGNQLEQAAVKDLFVISKGCTKETKHDTECLRRIVKNFCENYSSSDTSGLVSVAELIEEFLLEISSDLDLYVDTFVAIGEISTAASSITAKNADGIYRSVDIFLDKHRSLTEAEREEVCRVLDCHKMSFEACEHAVNNSRLPLRFVVQILFLSQLQMRSVILNQVHVLDQNVVGDELKPELDDEEEVRSEIERLSMQMTDLETECNIMRQEIQGGFNNPKPKKGKTNLWKEMKRKLGCSTTSHYSNSQVKKKKKVYPKY